MTTAATNIYFNGLSGCCLQLIPQGESPLLLQYIGSDIQVTIPLSKNIAIMLARSILNMIFDGDIK